MNNKSGQSLSDTNESSFSFVHVLLAEKELLKEARNKRQVPKRGLPIEEDLVVT
jgi:hypothetical protein